VYCGNNPVNFVDIHGNWAEKYSGFKLTYLTTYRSKGCRIKKLNGFDVKENLSFLSRKFCLEYAKDVVYRYGSGSSYATKRINGMSALRIAQEIWFHAIVYYIGTPLKQAFALVNLKWTWLEDKINSASIINVNADDKRAWVYSVAWNGASIISNYLSSKLGRRGYIRYIVL
jgi:hypothetical protein